MTDVDSQRPQLGDADNTHDGLPERLMDRQPSYVKTLTEMEVASMGRRSFNEDLKMPHEIPAERLPENWLKGDLLVTPALYAAARSKFTLNNSHWTTMYVALIRWDEACDNDCGSGGYVIGWYELAPAETLTFPNPMREQRIFYYAEATDGSIYEGSSNRALVMDAEFRMCLCNQDHIPSGPSPWYRADFDDLDLGEFSGVTFY